MKTNREALKTGASYLLAFALGALLLLNLTVGCAQLQELPKFPALPERVVVCSALYEQLPEEIRKKLDERHTDAVTVGGTTFFFRNAGDQGLECHEAEHRLQQSEEFLGIDFYPVYAYLHARRGYENNPLEKTARAAQKNCDNDIDAKDGGNW